MRRGVAWRVACRGCVVAWHNGGRFVPSWPVNMKKLWRGLRRELFCVLKDVLLRWRPVVVTMMITLTIAMFILTRPKLHQASIYLVLRSQRLS